jgi:hypothetical protein
MVILFLADDPWSVLFRGLDRFTDDFMESRDQPKQEAAEKKDAIQEYLKAINDSLKNADVREVDVAI